MLWKSNLCLCAEHTNPHSFPLPALCQSSAGLAVMVQEPSGYCTPGPVGQRDTGDPDAPPEWGFFLHSAMLQRAHMKTPAGALLVTCRSCTWVNVMMVLLVKDPCQACWSTKYATLDMHADFCKAWDVYAIFNAKYLWFIWCVPQTGIFCWLGDVTIKQL